ncbi:hypothetical protein BO71DRAFT_395701 [Aspergillus ellipticus CBS 707.79]|uniref:Uncharacterized protein n=1 Tax=Aspergillus ellipticus CBS 707.79 TaxID=1448320 RepID=A0A319DKG6_9EURO|nr:hypothetical protein BO71DRAFT_395701 [Aspergillus ellipticus CBS 707.79]
MGREISNPWNPAVLSSIALLFSQPAPTRNDLKARYELIFSAVSTPAVAACPSRTAPQPIPVYVCHRSPAR